MTPDQKGQIHAYARESAAAGIPTIEACPYPVGTDEWLHFQACYRCTGFRTDERRIAVELYFMASDELGQAL